MKPYLENVRKTSPLIHCITNYVTVNDVANMLLAAGASPVMSDEPEDVEDITSISSALLINIGTLHEKSIEAMFLAGKKAKEQGKIIVLDPVGAGASKLRTETAKRILTELQPQIIRGNISEIKALLFDASGTKGVDASIDDAVTAENLKQAADFAKACAKQSSAIVSISGAIDLIADADTCYAVYNGRAEMAKVTGTGCQLGALTAAFAAANPDALLAACTAAVCLMGYAGETAWMDLKKEEGNATYRNRIIDAVSNMTSSDLERGARYEIF